MTKPHDKALLSCPFCGSSDIRFSREAAAGRGFHSGDDVWSMCCYQCGASVPNRYNEYGRQLMVDAWNRRTPIEAVNGGDGWLDIASAPKDGRELLLTSTSWNGDIIVGSFYFGAWREGAFPEAEAFQVTHWMKLPAPPSTPSNEGSTK